MNKDPISNEELRSLNAILRTKALTSAVLPAILPLFICACIAFIAASFFQSHGTPFPAQQKDSSFEILQQLRENSELAVLNVTIEKLAVYTSDHQNNGFDFSALITNEKKFCSIPVEISLQFGYDLSELSANDITIDDNDEMNRSIEIRLPQPHIINSGYSLKYHDENTHKKPFCAAESGWIFKDSREVEHGLKEAIRHQAYQEVLKENWLPIFGKDVQQSTEFFFTNFLKSLGYQTVIIVSRKS